MENVEPAMQGNSCQISSLEGQIKEKHLQLELNRRHAYVFTAQIT